MNETSVCSGTADARKKHLRIEQSLLHFLAGDIYFIAMGRTGPIVVVLCISNGARHPV